MAVWPAFQVDFVSIRDPDGHIRIDFLRAYKLYADPTDSKLVQDCIGLTLSTNSVSSRVARQLYHLFLLLVKRQSLLRL